MNRQRQTDSANIHAMCNAITNLLKSNEVQLACGELQLDDEVKAVTHAVNDLQTKTQNIINRESSAIH